MPFLIDVTQRQGMRLHLIQKLGWGACVAIYVCALAATACPRPRGGAHSEWWAR